jgi:hypothetical protein
VRVDAAHPEDILVVGRLDEASLYPQFKRYQVFSASSRSPGLEGRRFRIAYCTYSAAEASQWPKVRDVLQRSAVKLGVEVRFFWRGFDEG